MAKKALPFTMKKSDIRLGTEAGHILQVGAPLALQEFLTQISFVCLCAFINRLGLTASSGYGVASKLISFIMLVPSSLMQSMSSFISQNVGAGKERRARQAMGFGMAFAFCVGVVIFALIQTKGYLAEGSSPRTRMSSPMPGITFGALAGRPSSRRFSSASWATPTGMRDRCLSCCRA